MFFVHRVLNAVTMMYNEADQLTVCHFVRPSTYLRPTEETEEDPDSEEPALEPQRE